MASDSNQTSARKQSLKSPYAALPIVAIAGVLVSVCLAFGNPGIWMTAEEAEGLADVLAEQSEEAEEDTVEAEVPEDMLVVSEYKAISQNSDGRRATNLKLATEAINGTIIGPGESFSFNDVVGDTEHDERYEITNVVYGDSMTEGRGGGICQVSTALYIAALKANLTIVERHPHSIASDYAPIGLDATLVYGLMDLRIQNNSLNPITISADSVGQTVDVKLLGTPLSDGISIDATSQIADRLDAAQATNPETGEPYSDDIEYIYVVDSYKVYYENGVKMYSDHLSTDTYLVPKSVPVVLAEGGVDPTK